MGVGGWEGAICVYVFLFCIFVFFVFVFFSLAQELHQHGELPVSLRYSQGKNLRFISWNLKGANQVVKRNKVMTHLKQLRGDIFFLQETHLCSSEVNRIKRPWIGHFFHSKFPVRARGAAILIHKNVPFELANSIEDPNGRFVIISGSLCGMPVVMACVYAPTWDDDKFISNFFSSLPKVDDHYLIIGGDFNMIQNPSLDRSSSNPQVLSKSAKVLDTYRTSLGLFDPWRAKSHSDNAFSFFSHVHHSYSRIDFFLLDNYFLSEVHSCEYHSIVISDHTPVSVDINFPRRVPPSRQWRLNSSLLTQASFKDFLQTQISFFFDTNDSPEISRCTLWETFKAFVRGQIMTRLIPRIKSTSGEVTSDPIEINKIFCSFYSNLYSSQCPADVWDGDNPLDGIAFPKMDGDLSRELGNPISVREVQEAIMSLQNGKTPGPDGFTVEFFKLFSATIAPALQTMYNESFAEGRLPPTLSEASISLLLKCDKDPLLCGSYRPISLLNVDLKILSKILAQRLQQVLSNIISTDQTGFMLGRHSFHNTRRLLNIISVPSSSTPEVIISLDAEKAFDRVEWTFLFFVLQKFGFPPEFISWIRLLYTNPRASVHTNGLQSAPFPLFRGTRQGCPLSPLLFAIAIEPLAIWLRQEGGFEGITRAGTVHKLSQFS